MSYFQIYATCLIVALAVNVSSADLKQSKITLDANNPTFELHEELDSQDEFHLIAKNEDMETIVNKISQFTGVVIHHSSLPDASVSRDCQGNIQQLLMCVLGTHLNMALKHDPTNSPGRMPISESEIWLLDALESSTDSSNSQRQENSQYTEPSKTIAAEQKAADYIQLLLEQAKDPKQRGAAIASLAIAGHKDDLTIRLALKKALTDENPGIRAQAIFALSQREGEEAALEDLQKALQDNNVEVRRMVLDSSNNWHLLQQALKDNDPTIRQYAETKLVLLRKTYEGDLKAKYLPNGASQFNNARSWRQSMDRASVVTDR